MNAYGHVYEMEEMNATGKDLALSLSNLDGISIDGRRRLLPYAFSLRLLRRGIWISIS